MKFKLKHIFIAILIIIFGGSYMLYAGNANTELAQGAGGLGALGDIHEHSDMRLYIDGAYIDLSQQQYQLKAQRVHFEGGDGDILHVHSSGISMAYFLNTLGVPYEDGCLTYQGTKYCEEGDKKVRFYINGVDRTSEISTYEIGNFDQYLVTYGTEAEAIAQLDTVTDRSETVPSTNMELSDLPDQS